MKDQVMADDTERNPAWRGHEAAVTVAQINWWPLAAVFSVFFAHARRLELRLSIKQGPSKRRMQGDQD